MEDGKMSSLKDMARKKIIKEHTKDSITWDKNKEKEYLSGVVNKSWPMKDILWKDYSLVKELSSTRKVNILMKVNSKMDRNMDMGYKTNNYRYMKDTFIKDKDVEKEDLIYWILLISQY